MGINKQIERVLLQLLEHAGRMAEADRFFTAPHEPLQQIIDGEVARRAGQHFFAAGDCLADQLDDRRRLAGAGRAVNDRHVGGCEREFDRFILRGVQPCVERRRRLSLFDFEGAISQEGVAKLRQAAALGGAGLRECAGHSLTGDFVAGDVEAKGGPILLRLGRLR